MRTSCNGCRVLRKGCGDNCTIRPCLQWIKNPQSQANATVFLAKFYGRAGLINLVNTGPDHLRPAIFRSLLYEACGRIANPVHGSVGLLWSGDWQLCQAAVEAVLKGTPIARAPITNEAAVTSEGPPLKAYDIRHVSKDEKSAASNDLHRPKTSCKFKRSGTKYRPSRASRPQPRLASKAEPNRSTSHESSLSHQSELGANLEGDSKEVESMVSEERADPSQLFRAESESVPEKGEEVRGSTGIGLELTLGLEPVVKAPNVVPVKKRRFEEFRSTESESGGCASEMELGF